MTNDKDNSNITTIYYVILCIYFPPKEYLRQDWWADFSRIQAENEAMVVGSWQHRQGLDNMRD